jgi:hypothetical protein
MSTKDPLVPHDDFQVYRDYFDEGFVWLAPRKIEFEATSSEVRVKIPVAQWEVLRRAPGGDFDMLDVTDDQIVAQVQCDDVVHELGSVQRLVFSRACGSC